MSDPEPMDVEKVLECLNEALELQLRSLLQFTQASGSMDGELKWHLDPATALDHLIATQDEVPEALHAVIPHSGQEAREHLMEHIIMRKQNQIDWLRRARREP